MFGYLRKFLGVLPDALKTECSKCNQVQKDRSDKVIKFLMKNRNSDFELLTDKYDPTGEYKKILEKYDREHPKAKL